MVIVLMGVSGVGKTTVGSLLAHELEWEFYDADAFHPPENIAKMSNQIPLTDADRWPWLDALHAFIQQRLVDKQPAILACSALKHSYRIRLSRNTEGLALVYLKGAYALIAQRMKERQGHYMKAALLRSQFEALEEPDDVYTLEVDDAPQQLVQTIRAHFNL